MKANLVMLLDKLIETPTHIISITSYKKLSLTKISTYWQSISLKLSREGGYIDEV